MLITAKDLDFSRALTKRPVFERLFPCGAEVTIENARRAAGAGLSLRCAAKHLMRPSKFGDFERRANALGTIYRNNTVDTRAALEAICPHARKIQWMEADTVHEKNKATHWSAYLDGLAKAFVLGFEEKREAA